MNQRMRIFEGSSPVLATNHIFMVTVRVVVGIFLLIHTCEALAQANDTCTGAITLNPGETNTQSTVAATSTSDPAHCQIGRGVWYKITPQLDQRVNVSTVGSDFDTVLSVYTGSCAGLALAECNNNYGPLSFSTAATLSLNGRAGTTYYVLAGGYNGAAGNLKIAADLRAPPSNDTCANAVALTSGVTNVATNSYATEIGDPVPACSELTRGIWYSFTPPADGRLSISTAGSTLISASGNSFSPYLAVYTGSCGALAPVQCTNVGSLDFSVSNNNTYYVLAGSFSSSVQGNLQIVARFRLPPSNDTCAGAIPLDWGVTNTVSTTNATELNESPPCGFRFARGVWYSITPTADETVHLSTCGSSFQTSLVIYTNGCGSLTQMLCVPQGRQCHTPDVSFSGIAGKTYYILVGGYNNSSGTLSIVALKSPTNDICAGAVTLVSGVTNFISTMTATSTSDPTHCQNGRGVWYTITPPSDRRVNIITDDSDFNTVLSVYTGSCAGLTLVECNDDYGPFSSGTAASLSLNGRAGTTYYVLAGGRSGAAGNLRIAMYLRTPPVNDTCINAIALISGVTNVATNSYATEIGDPVPACSGLTRGIWYSFTPPADGRLSISTSGSSFSPYLAAYTGTCGALAPVQCTNVGSLDFSVSSDVTYYILAGSSSSSVGGSLHVVAQFRVPPGNDTCAGAIPLDWGVTNTVSTTNATELNESPACGVQFARGLWYSITPTTSETVHISTCGSSFQTTLAIYTNGCGSLTQMLCVPQGRQCSRPDVSFSGSAGQTYYILVGGYNRSSGTLNIVGLKSPANDTCAGAVTLISGVTNFVSTITATTNDDPVASCRASSSWFGDYYTWQTPFGVWYTVTPEGNRRIKVAKTGNHYAVLSAFKGTCGNLVEEQCSGDFEYWSDLISSYTHAKLSFSAAAGTTYYIAAYGGSGDLQLTAMILTPPSNDECDGALPLALGVTNTLNISSATEIGEAGQGLDHGVWYTLTLERDSGIAISTCGSDFVTGVRVYTGACGSLSPVPAIATPLCSFRASATFAGVAGATYYIFVGGQNTFDAGNLRIVAFESPLNDSCAGAITMIPGRVYTANTLTATDTADPRPSCVSIPRGVWYRYTPTENAPLSVAACGAGLAVYSGNCDALTPVACSASGSQCPTARTNFNGVAGTTYYFLAQGDTSGALQIVIPVVDLVPSQLYATDGTGGPPIVGRRFLTGFRLTNQGTNTVYTGWTDRLTLSNAVTNLVFHFPGTHYAPAGNGYLNALDRTLSAIPAGTYSLIAETDVNGEVVETNEMNNIQLMSVLITNLLPAVNLLAPTNSLAVTSCVPVAFDFAAMAQKTSYDISTVEFRAGQTLLVQTNRNVSRFNNLYLAHGEHSITAQAVDSFALRGTSQVVTVSVRWPGELHRLRADLNTAGERVACMRGIAESEYLIESTLSLGPTVPWHPYATNTAFGSIVIFTNRAAEPQRYFRAKLLP